MISLRAATSSISPSNRTNRSAGRKLVQSLLDEFPNVTAGVLPERAEDDWTWTATRLRLGLDYLRYQHPVFDRAYKLRERSRGRTPGGFVMLGDAVHAAGGWARRGAETALRRIERAIPAPPSIRAFIEASRPDLMLLTPLIDLGSSQIDYLRAARELGVPTALCVWSWDHLSSKALIRECPERVFVWNETQKREAVELHRVPAQRVVITGAQCFDHWFDRTPSRTRDEFCAQIGLDARHPFILWVCSALIYGSPPEAPFVLDWIRRLRASGHPALREAGVLVRPHPSRTAEWESIDTRELDAVVWGGNPIDESTRADYFDSIVHSAAVVGLNTSAFIEAGIVGRPVLTIVVPEFRENQHGTVHFELPGRRGRWVRHSGRRVRCASFATGGGGRNSADKHEAVRERFRASARPRPGGNAGVRRGGRGNARHSRRGCRSRRVGSGMALDASAHRGAQGSTEVRTLDTVAARARERRAASPPAAPEGDSPCDEPCRTRRRPAAKTAGARSAPRDLPAGASAGADTGSR